MRVWCVYRAAIATAVCSVVILTGRGAAAAACQRTCAQQLRDCKRACTSGAQARRQCRAACGRRSNCTAPGTRIRTLAYVLNECTTDGLGRSSLRQKLLIRRSNCDPVLVMEARTSTPVPNSFGLCSQYGLQRIGLAFIAPPVRAGVFEGMAVLPDGSGVVFNVTRQHAQVPALTPEPPDEGIFFVRADGTGLQRFPGPPGRVPSVLGSWSWGASPDSRQVAFIDLGPSTAGHEAPQVFLLDLRSGRRRQLTHQPRVARPEVSDPGIWFPTFLDGRTVGFFAGSTSLGTFTALQVETDGGPEKELPPIIPEPGARIVSQFGVTGVRRHAVLGLYPDRPATNQPHPFPRFVREIFLVDGRQKITQMTTLDRFDTSVGGQDARGMVVGNRVLFVASANPFGKNPDEICQFFSVSTVGDDLRQVTRLPSDGERSPLGCVSAGPGCGIFNVSTTVDQATGTVLFSSSCDPVGANPFGDQIFAMRPDGSGLRQLTDARGMTEGPDGSVHVEVAGPFAYQSQKSR